MNYSNSSVTAMPESHRLSAVASGTDLSRAGLQSLAAQLVTETFGDPWGLAGPADYDTAHIVRAWARRPQCIPDRIARDALEWMMRRQNTDGSWGPSAVSPVYRLADTMAAVAALLALGSTRTELRITGAAHRGLQWLTSDLARYRQTGIPTGMIGWKYLLPALLDEIQTALGPAGLAVFDERISQALAALGSWHDGLAAVRAAAAARRQLPPHLDYIWEVFGQSTSATTNLAAGHLACSPSATAAALAASPAAAPPAAVEYLRVATGRLGGAAPNVMPVDVYERAWLLMTLIRGDVPLTPMRPDQVAAAAHSWITPTGAGLASGWVPDADDTAAALWICSRAGFPVEPAALLLFETDQGFGSFASSVYANSAESAIGARELSVSVNAHVLEALDIYIQARPDKASVYAGPVAKARQFLLDMQSCDGSWDVDKWHSAPVYAVSSAILALQHHSTVRSYTSVRSAIKWLLDTQRPDGSWGRWCGTLEETAHAVLTLATTRTLAGAAGVEAIGRGARFLRNAWYAGPDDVVRTPLWHGKTLHRHRGHDAYPIAALFAASDGARQ